MKKLFAITLAAAMLVLTMACCDKKDTKDKDSDNKPETMATVEKNTAPIDVPTAPVDELNFETLVIENENYKFTLEKSDFEKNYSDELLMNISAFIPLEYGVDDYVNWDGTPEEVINDALKCCFDSRSSMYFERFETTTPETEAAEAEIEKCEYKVYDNYVVTNIENINSYLYKRFGPDARQFTPEDFDTYEEAVTKDGSITEGIGTIGYRYIYLPESEVVMCYMSEATGFGGTFTGLYIYDIQTVGDDYVVKAVACECYDEDYIYADTFEALQNSTLELFAQYTPETLDNYTMVIGETEDGDVYMKSVEKTQLTSEK